MEAEEREKHSQAFHVFCHSFTYYNEMQTKEEKMGVAWEQDCLNMRGQLV